MNATTLSAEITAFAAAVRAALADLPADEVEELTDGLEADLAEAYAEDLARELPDPAAYANELRGAAGLPTPVVERGSRLRTVAGPFAERVRDLDRNLRRSPAMAAVLDFLVTLRPAWWIVRGWAAYQCVGAFFGFEGDLLPSGGLWLVLAALVAGSVFVGLRQWPAGVRVLIAGGNAIAVVATVVALAQVPSSQDVDRAWSYADSFENDSAVAGPDGTGIWLNGTEVTNIFAYDATGQVLDGVQLFDQDGTPLATSVPGGNGCLAKDEWDECTTPGAWVPTQLETGATAWNVYPMRMAESSFEDPTAPIARAVPQDRPAPFVKVPALMTAAPESPEPSAEGKSAAREQ